LTLDSICSLSTPVLEALDVPDDLQDAADSAGAAVLAALLQGHRRMLVEIHDPLLDPTTSGGRYVLAIVPLLVPSRQANPTMDPTTSLPPSLAPIPTPSGFGGGDEANSYAENLASAVELLVLPTAAALEGGSTHSVVLLCVY
tara:strand:+ start:495 stop:923 length:429 start_codon:yes stop_codon:yes gene_type:complete